MHFKMSSAKWQPFCLDLNVLTHKQLEMHGRILSTEATDALVLKHQAISTHSADQLIIVLDLFDACYIYCAKH